MIVAGPDEVLAWICGGSCLEEEVDDVVGAGGYLEDVVEVGAGGCLVEVFVVVYDSLVSLEADVRLKTRVLVGASCVVLGDLVELVGAESVEGGGDLE